VRVKAFYACSWCSKLPRVSNGFKWSLIWSSRWLCALILLLLWYKAKRKIRKPNTWPKKDQFFLHLHIIFLHLHTLGKFTILSFLKYSIPDYTLHPFYLLPHFASATAAPVRTHLHRCIPFHNSCTSPSTSTSTLSAYFSWRSTHLSPCLVHHHSLFTVCENRTYNFQIPSFWHPFKQLKGR